MNSIAQPTSPLANTSKFSVQANMAWQKTNISIPVGIEVIIRYDSGEWTADPQNNGGKLYNADGDTSIIVPENQSSYPLTGVAMGALVGRINDGQPFYIGNGPHAILSTTGGELELCINDDLTGTYGAGLSDNSGSVDVSISIFSNTNTSPDFSKPLAQEPAQTSPGVPTSQLGPLKYLIGTWTNQNLPNSDKGGNGAPYSYNVMPLPQVDPSTPSGYILKNFTYYEELTFTAIHGNAANRGGSGQQIANTLFYEQRVYFAEGPNKDALVHAENGSLLFLTDSQQPLGPYGNGEEPGLGTQVLPNGTVPTQAFNLVKQVSVPHGNSILALGNYSTAEDGEGVPSIPPVSPLPTGVNTDQYSQLSYVSNPYPKLTENPNQVLVDALNVRPCDKFITLTMSSENGKGGVTNIGFEQQHANVVKYDFTYWLESFNGGQDFTQLQYSQTITMQLPINGQLINFPHITTNTLTKVS